MVECSGHSKHQLPTTRPDLSIPSLTRLYLINWHSCGFLGQCGWCRHMAVHTTTDTLASSIMELEMLGFDSRPEREGGGRGEREGGDRERVGVREK